MDEGTGNAVGFPHLFAPITVGTMNLRSRVMLPPHASAIGNIFGTDEEAARNIAYFEQRVRAGVAWVGSISAHLKNTVIPASSRPASVLRPRDSSGCRFSWSASSSSRTPCTLSERRRPCRWCTRAACRMARHLS